VTGRWGPAATGHGDTAPGVAPAPSATSGYGPGVPAGPGHGPRGPGFGPLPQPVVGDQKIRPSGWWFAAAGGIALIGIVLAIVLVVMGVVRMMDAVDGFNRAAVPGTFDVEIDDPGGYTVYHEYPGADVDWRPFPNVELTDPSGDSVLLTAYTSDVTYATSDRDGRALYSFRADRAGTYTVETTGEPGSTVAVGRGLGRDLVRSFVLAGILGFVGVVGGTVLAIVTGVRRGRSRRQVAWSPPGPFGPPGAGWASPGQPPPGGGQGWSSPDAQPGWSPSGWGPGRPPPPPGATFGEPPLSG
jgi:hypothetical protein